MSDEDEEEAKPDADEAEEKPAEDPVSTPPEKTQEETKDSKKKAAAAAKGGKKNETVATPVEVDDPNKKPDPNIGKIIPGVVHLKRENVSTIYAAQQFINYCQTLKAEESFCLQVEDNHFDSLKPELVDFAFGAGVVGYLNLSGFGKPEKSTKAARFG